MDIKKLSMADLKAAYELSLIVKIENIKGPDSFMVIDQKHKRLSSKILKEFDRRAALLMKDPKPVEKMPVKQFIPPTIQEMQDFFVNNGYSADAAGKAWKYYNEADWRDSKGNKVKNWKQKMRGVWFKDEYLESGKNELNWDKIR